MENEISFKYQNLLLRTLIFIPLIFLLAYIEDVLFGNRIDRITFIVISIIIMFVLGYSTYRYTEKTFVRVGKAKLSQKDIVFHSRKKAMKCIDLSDISTVECREIKLYGIKVQKLSVYYNCNKKKKCFVLYSEDLKDDKDGAVGIIRISEWLTAHGKTDNQENRYE